MTTTSNPTQLRLPGQVAAPEGPIDMTPMYVMHHGFRRDLDRFTDAVRRTPIGARETWTLLAPRWELFTEVLHHHHSGEDAGIWPRLMERVQDADRATLIAMEAEHSEIDPLLEACCEGFRRLAQVGDEDARSALSVRLVALRNLLEQHLAHEETEAIALIQALITPAEWIEISDKHFKNDELTLGKIARLVPWAAHGLSREALDRALTDAGLPFRIVWLLTWRRFARREGRTFAYA
jgi:hypothetical protein